MPFETLEERIDFAIKFALTQYKYKPPPRCDKDPNARDRYYDSVARAVREQLMLSYEITSKPYDLYGGKP
jgi:hypothetical protein